MCSDYKSSGTFSSRHAAPSKRTGKLHGQGTVLNDEQAQEAANIIFLCLPQTCFSSTNDDAAATSTSASAFFRQSKCHCVKPQIGQNKVASDKSSSAKSMRIRYDISLTTCSSCVNIVNCRQKQLKEELLLTQYRKYSTVLIKTRRRVNEHKL